MNELKFYKKCENELSKLNKEHDEERLLFEDESNKIRQKQWRLERELKDKIDKEYNKLEKEKDQYNDQMNIKRDPYLKHIDEFKRIIKYMEIERSESKYNFKVYEYGYEKDEFGYDDRSKRIEIEYNPIGTLKDDEFAVIKAFIVNNDKPKNNRSLIVAGSTIFYNSLLEIPHTYGMDAHTDGTRIQLIVKDAPDDEVLLSYYDRNKGKILKEFLIEHEKLEQEYKEAIPKTKDKSWELVYLNHQKEYYETGYHNGTETEEYKDILVKIEEVKAT